jgi:Trk K+ transport system NAD-binding subunit
MMGFVVLAELLGAELILGAFLAGMVISLIKAPQDDDLVIKLEAFGFGFFIPVFFIMVGVELDLRALFESPTSIVLLPVLLIVALVVKIGPALLYRRLISWRETFAAALLLNTHLSLEIAVAVIGLRLGLISPATNAAVIVFAILTVFLMPILFNAIQPAVVQESEKFILIFGAKGDFSYQVAQELMDQGEKVKFIEPDSELRERTQRKGFEVIPAEVTEESLCNIGPPKIRNFLVLGTTDARNLTVSKTAVCAGIETITAMVNQPTEIPQFTEIGVQPFSPGVYRSAMLSMLVRNPDMFNLLTSTTESQSIREFQLCNPGLDGKRVRHLQLSGDLLIVSISRDGELLIPHGNMRVHLEDKMTVLGSQEALEKAGKLLGS